MDLKELKDLSARRHPWERARVAALKSILRGTIRGGITVLDMGCGDGYVASEVFRENGRVRVTAYDANLTPETMEALRRVTGGRMEFTETLPERGAFDLVLLLDVLEHVENDRDFLMDIMERFMAPGGRILISAPAFNILFGDHDRALGHYRRYSLGEISRLARGAGLEVKSSGYFFTSLLAPKFIGNLLFRKKIAEGVGGWRGGPLLTSLFTGLLRLDAGLGILLSRTGIKVPGLTVWLLCERPR